MATLGPEFIDITWGAGGTTSDLTLEICQTAQSVYGLETCMHLTCTNMPKEKIDDALEVKSFIFCFISLIIRLLKNAEFRIFLLFVVILLVVTNHGRNARMDFHMLWIWSVILDRNTETISAFQLLDILKVTLTTRTNVLILCI